MTACQPSPATAQHSLALPQQHNMQQATCSQKGDSFLRGIFEGEKNALRVLLWLCVTCIEDEVETSALQTYPRVAFTRHREGVRQRHMSSSVASCENKL